MTLFAQGDILLRRHTVAPKTTKSVAPEGGRLILARGEATGHHHSIDATKGTLTLDEGGVMFLTIEELTTLDHQEHRAITLEPGTYEVVRQREWTDAQEPITVSD